MKKKLVFFDFDKTIHFRESGDDINILRGAIPRGIELIKVYLKNGHEVKIFTARHRRQWNMIWRWFVAQGLPELDIVNVKSSRMDCLFDDKSINFLINEGISSVDMMRSAAILIEMFAKSNNNIAGQCYEWLNIFDRFNDSWEKNGVYNLGIEFGKVKL